MLTAFSVVCNKDKHPPSSWGGGGRGGERSDKIKTP